MKLVSYLDEGRTRVGAVVEDGVVDLSDGYDSMLTLIEEGSVDEVRSLAVSGEPSARVDEVVLLAPIPEPRRNLFCVGWNYLPHFEEGKGRRGEGEIDPPDHPAFFTKATTSVAGPVDDIPLDTAFSERMDFEAELAVIVGRPGRSIPAEDAMRHVFGYTAANDVTARDAQRRHGGQWFKGKSVDRSSPMGPWIVLADDVADPQNLDFSCHVNGVEKQNSSTRHMYFSIPKIIEELSLAMTLLPGDIILTGTPEGVGLWRDPPEFLRAGDEVVVTLSGIGELTNKVVERSLTRQEGPYVA